MEEWRAIPEFEDYEVSNLGNVRRVGIIEYKCSDGSIRYYKPKSGNIKLQTNSDGRYIISLRKDKKTTSKLVHRLVASAFIDNPFNYPEVDHINRNCNDNRVENLRWCRSFENAHNKIEKNKTEYTGVYKANSKYAAKIKRLYLGVFDTPEEAHAAYVAKKNEIAGEFSPFNTS